MRPGTDVTRAPAGVEGAPVVLEGRAGAAVAALVSRVDASTYAPGTIEARAPDVAWVGPRAVAHDAVLSWASEAGAVVPFAMFTLFAGARSLHAMLAARGPALAGLLDRVGQCREWSVRVFRVDDRVAASLSEYSPAVADIARQAAAASPGQRYLLERKANELRGAEIARLGGAAAREAFTALSALAEQAVRDPLPAAGGAGSSAGAAVLDASFLVRRDRSDAFRSGAGALAAALAPRGFEVELSGPWPPYHFVGDPS